MLAVRVIAANAEYGFPEADLSNYVFGTNGDTVNLKSQYAACSHGQLNFNPAADRGGGGPSISNGVVTITVTTRTRQGDNRMRNAITDKLNQVFGVNSPDALADHVMYCLPPRTMNGIAYAYINHWNSVYSNEWCNYVSSQMHEVSIIGHY